MREFFFRTQQRFRGVQRTGDDSHVPDQMVIKCPNCRELIYQKQLHDNLKVCPKCQHHMRMTAHEWLSLLDADSFIEYDGDIAPSDPLGFVSAKESYAEKLQETQDRTGLLDTMVSGIGTIEGEAAVVAVTDFNFMGGSIGSVFGEKMARAIERSLERRIPLLTISSSGGARMHEGVVALMQLPKMNIALARLAAARIPHIAVAVDPCYGGVPASYVSVADIIIAEPGASIGFAGRRVIEQTTREKLPVDFQTAEFMLEHGLIDMVVPRSDMRNRISRLLRFYRASPASEDADTVEGLAAHMNEAFTTTPS